MKSFDLNLTGLWRPQSLPSVFAKLPTHERIRDQDPLRAYEQLKTLPELNRRGDVTGMLFMLRKLLQKPETGEISWEMFESWGYDQWVAAMRDVGILLGSLRRHGEEPVDLWPALEVWLLEAARQTGLPPRDTLLHYTIWNSPHALRTYTDLTEEKHLIEAVRMAYPALEEAVDRLVSLVEISLESAEFEARANRALESLKEVRNAAVYTYRHVDRGVFISSIRPYFEPIRVTGKDYLGPGAVAMPLFVFDHVLWSAEVAHPAYVGFKQDYLPVTLPRLQAIYYRFSEGGSLLGRLGTVLEDPCLFPSDRLRRNLESLDRLFVVLQRFRAVHLRMARQAYRAPTAPGESRAFTKGSGGYAPSMLEEIDQLTASARSRLGAWIEGVGGSRGPEVFEEEKE